MPPFERTLFVGWGDLDFNGHMKNTSYLDRCGDVRMMFFADGGFSMREFEKLRFGPVISRDELDYRRELRLLEQFRVTLVASGMSDDGSRFRLRNEFFRMDGERVARVTSTGGWLDFERRRLATPPDALRVLMAAMMRADDFEVLTSSTS